MDTTLKTVGIFGATGFLGRAVAEELAGAGWAVVRFSRTPPRGVAGWRAVEERLDLGGLGAVVNLAGESITRRWTGAVWRRIRDSRVGLTESIVDAIACLEPAARPRVLVNASAVGYYPSSGDLELPEAASSAEGPLGELCRDWEAAAVEAESSGVRTVRLRLGIVLGEGGEAWRRLRAVFRLGVGGRLGSGRQWMPWIHVEDVAGAIEFALATEDLKGPLNLGAPEPVTNREFTRQLAAALRRPAVFHVPAIALRLALGGFGETLLASYRIVPERLLRHGFEFRHRTLEEALQTLVS
jgi:uncharacterized protein (TIGR01777 family)